MVLITIYKGYSEIKDTKLVNMQDVMNRQILAKWCEFKVGRRDVHDQTGV